VDTCFLTASIFACAYAPYYLSRALNLSSASLAFYLPLIRLDTTVQPLKSAFDFFLFLISFVGSVFYPAFWHRRDGYCYGMHGLIPEPRASTSRSIARFDFLVSLSDGLCSRDILYVYFFWTLMPVYYILRKTVSANQFFMIFLNPD
jgi:hypothetical protein